MLTFRYLLIATLALAILTLPAAARDGLPAGFVYLRDVDASIVQDMRYAQADNFVGRALPGYQAAECVLRRDVAIALSKVQADLASIAHDPEKWAPVFGKDHVPRESLSLKVYDCYRPTRAVRAMAQWAHDGSRANATKRFYPRLQKGSLFALGYISSQSAHSTGTAIDLTMTRRPSATVAPFDPAASYGACTGPAAARSPDTSLDMGTGFDCFDGNSHTYSGAVDAEQKRWRGVLVKAMGRHGFRNYFREWWHFSFGPAGERYDFPIVPRR